MFTLQAVFGSVSVFCVGLSGLLVKGVQLEINGGVEYC